MAIRKTGSVTGEVTGVEPVPTLTPAMAREAALQLQESAQRWTTDEERELAAENDRTDV